MENFEIIPKTENSKGTGNGRGVVGGFSRYIQKIFSLNVINKIFYRLPVKDCSDL